MLSLIIPDAHLISWKICILTGTYHEENIAVAVALTECQSASNRGAVELEGTSGCFMHSEALICAYDKVMAFVCKLEAFSFHVLWLVG